MALCGFSEDGFDGVGEALHVVFAFHAGDVDAAFADHAESLILDSVKGGYASADGKTRLLNTQNGWSIRK